MAYSSACTEDARSDLQLQVCAVTVVVHQLLSDGAGYGVIVLRRSESKAAPNEQGV
jgi:hypothetical protein